jgi:hypothetical protein
MAKTAVRYFFLNRVAQMQRGALHGGNRRPCARHLAQGKQQIVDHVCPKFSHDGDAICLRGYTWGG